VRNLFILCIFSSTFASAWAQTDSSTVVYFLEPRIGQPKDQQTIRSQPLAQAEKLFQLKPNQLLRFECGKKDYLDRLNRERRGDGAWIRFNIDGKKAQQKAYVYDFWKSFVTIDPSLQPVHLRFTDNSREVLSVFNRPGILNWQACLRQKNECIAWPVRNSELTLVDTRIMGEPGARHLYYKVKYSYATPPAWEHSGEGWIPAAVVNRVLDQPPEFNRQAFDPSSYITKNDAEEMVSQAREAGREAGREEIFEHFNIERAEEGQRFSRWSPPAEPAEASEASRGPASMASGNPQLRNIKIDFDLDAQFGVINIARSGRSPYVSNQEEVAGLAISGIAPILFDLEADTSFEYLTAVHRSKGVGPMTDMMRFEQNVLYTLSTGSKDSALKFGAGWNLQWLTSGMDYGLVADVSLHGVAVYDSPGGMAYAKFGPVTNTSGVLSKSAETVFGGGLRLHPSLGYDSLMVTAEIRYMTDMSSLTNDRTSIWTTLFGLKKTF
jgi:hypothetical protein